MSFLVGVDMGMLTTPLVADPALSGAEMLDHLRIILQTDLDDPNQRRILAQTAEQRAEFFPFHMLKFGGIDLDPVLFSER